LENAGCVAGGPVGIGMDADISGLILRRLLERRRGANFRMTILSWLQISQSIRAGDMIQKGRTGGDQFETSAVADRQMNWWVTDTDRRKDRGVRPDRAQGAHEHEAKEHDLPLVRQGRA
jgi:hypothetical protein